jgi:iron(II)-dependent oxidoreductase
MATDRESGDFLFILLPTCTAGLALGWALGEPPLTAVGVIGLCYGAVRHSAVLRRGWRRFLAGLRRVHRPVHSPIIAPCSADPEDTDGLVAQMLRESRCALLLRPQIAQNLSERQYRHALETLERGMALVPDGEVALGELDDALDGGELDDQEIAAHHGRVVRVDHFFLDRFPVTNEQFHQFVLAGAYQQLNLWDESIWPAILDFVDSTGQPGPAFWRRGRYAADTERHPVAGVSWYEAMAYARWVGKRLPTDAEWVKAAAWPVSLGPSSRLQRRYPWGDSLERHRANLWGSGPSTTVPVDDYPDGVSVGGVYQLVGNVWEWTRGEFRGPAGMQGELVFEVPMKIIRGGAFDTYFDNQATCQFQSGETALARKPNIGFRCALSACDLMLARGTGELFDPAELDVAMVAEVQS